MYKLYAITLYIIYCRTTSYTCLLWFYVRALSEDLYSDLEALWAPLPGIVFYPSSLQLFSEGLVFQPPVQVELSQLFSFFAISLRAAPCSSSACLFPQKLNV